MIKYHIGLLFDIAQLADHFYPIVKGLTGRDAIYQNPGASLRSFAVFNCRNRIVELPEEITLAYEECVSFINDETVWETIEKYARTYPYELVDKLFAITGPSEDINQAMRDFNDLNCILDQGRLGNDDQFVQALIDIKTKAEEFASDIESTSSDSVA